MSTIKKLQIAAMSALMLGAIGCGNKEKSSNNSELNPVCTTINCLSSVTWKLQLQGNVFPAKARLDINGETVLDECYSKQLYKIDRDSAPQSITLHGFFVPKEGQVRIRVVDRGYGCKDESTFLYHENVPFEVVKGAFGSEILINL
jgi:hypothetical protein